MYRWIQVNASVDTVGLRREEFQGKPYLVIPVTALIGDIVVWPSTSEHPEFIPADVLELYPEGWNYRAVVLNHPAATAPTANTIENLEQTQLGLVFNARFEANELRMDAYVDEERVSLVGNGADEVIQEIAAGKRTAVSIGAFVLVELIEGEHDGLKYWSVWRFCIPDHLALLSLDRDGACSVEIGCGAKLENVIGAEAKMKNITGLTALLSKLMPRPEHVAAPTVLASGITDGQLRALLWEATRAVEPGFTDVDAVYHEDSTYVYETYLNDKYEFWERTFALDGRVVTIGDERVAVTPAMTFEKVQATAAATPPIVAAPAQATQPCGCKGGSDVNKKEILDKLAARGYKRDKLEALDEKALQALEESLPVETATAPVVEPAPAQAPAAPAESEPEQQAVASTAQSVEQWLASVGAPDAVRNSITRALGEEQTQRNNLVANLAAAQKTFSKEDLSRMSLDQLRQMASLQAELQPARAVDFSVNPRATPAADTAKVPPAPAPITAALARKRALQSAN